MSNTRRRGLETTLKLATWIAIFALLFVLADFAVDFRPRNIQDSYRFTMPELSVDQPEVIQRDQLRIVVLKRSEQLQQQLLDTSDLQDPESKRSRQPDDAQNILRSKVPDLFVSFALGTDFECPLLIEDNGFAESCSDATYDFAGRAKKSNRRFDNLVVPDYRLSDDGKHITVFP